MDNEVDIIKIKNENYQAKYKEYFNHKINKILLIQIIILIVIIINLSFNNNSHKIKEQKPLKSEDLAKNNDNTNKLILNEKLKLLKLITNNDEIEYKGIRNCLINDPDTQKCIYHLILPKEVIGKKRILLGEKYDGCYVLLDDFLNIKIAYSFGISRNIQFDKELANRGIDIYMYDHTINGLPYQNPKFHWKKIGLCGMKTKNNYLKNLEELIFENGHANEKNMILKMDIEFWEWESIIDLKEETLSKFKYIAIEYHFFQVKDNLDLFYNVIKKISKTHQSFYARCNGDRSKKVNFGNNRICHILEVCYIIRKDNKFIKDETIYPIYEFDYSIPKEGALEMNLNLLKLFD